MNSVTGDLQWFHKLHKFWQKLFSQRKEYEALERVLKIRFFNKNTFREVTINHSKLPLRYFLLFMCLLDFRQINWKYDDTSSLDFKSIFKVILLLLQNKKDKRKKRQQIKNNKFPDNSFGHNLQLPACNNCNLISSLCSEKGKYFTFFHPSAMSISHLTWPPWYTDKKTSLKKLIVSIYLSNLE